MPGIIAIRTVRSYIHPKNVIRDIKKEDLAGTRVMFINMPLRETAVPNCAPNGICILAAYLQKYGVDVSILDLNAYRIKDAVSDARKLENGRAITLRETEILFARHIQKHGDQDMIALSGMITTLRWQEDVAKIARKLQPDTFLVSGNGLATEFRTGLFNWIPELDGVAHSEGDFSVIKMAYDAAQIRRFGIKGAMASGKLAPYCLGEFAGKVRFLYDGGRPDDLDDVPFPAYGLIESDALGFPILETYLKNEIWGLNANNSSATPFTMKRSINTVSSRGCPFKCNFCFRGATGERDYGVRSAANFASELSHYNEKYGVDFVGVTDDNFMVRRDRIEAMVPILGPFVEATGLRWGTHGRLDEAADMAPNGSGGWRFNSPKRVDAMAKAGCVYIGFGAESADPETLGNMGKGGFILANGMVKVGAWEFPRTMVEGIRNTKHSGIHANCILEGQSVLAPDAIGAVKSFYDGPCIEVTLENGRRISVTENHPILTTRGWVLAKELNQFDQVFFAVDGERISASIDPNNNQRPTSIENIFRSFDKSPGMISRRMKMAPEDFHGDGEFIQGNIDVVGADGFLLDNLKSLISQVRGQFDFSWRDILMNYLKSFRPITQSLGGSFAAASCTDSGGDPGVTLGNRHSSVFSLEPLTHDRIDPRSMFPTLKGRNPMEFPRRSQFDSRGEQFTSQSTAIDMDLASQFKNRFAGLIATDRIANIKQFRYSGYVYDLQCAEYGLYNCNSLIVSNCTWIMAYPGERLENLKTTVAFIKWQEDFYASFGDAPDSVNKSLFVATAYPGTEMFRHPKVKALLGENFGISFDAANDPVCDENLHFYVLELDDATKVMRDQKGRPLNFGDMTEDQFMRVRELVDVGRVYDILNMG